MVMHVEVHNELTAALALARILNKEEEFKATGQDVIKELAYLKQVKDDLLSRNFLSNDKVKLVEVMMDRTTVVIVKNEEKDYVKG